MPSNFAQRVANLRQQQGRDQREASLLATAVLAYGRHQTANPGANQTYHVVLDPGVTAFHKPFAGIDPTLAHAYGHTPSTPPLSECAAWRLAVAFGPPFDAMVPPCVLREIQGQEGSLSLGVTGVPHAPGPFVAAPEQVAAAAFFDALIAQQDRHSGNYRWEAAAGQLHLIDHGFAFARPGDFLNESVFVKARWPTGSQTLTQQELALLQALVGSGDLHGLAGFLETERADALRARAQRMLARGELLRPGDF